MFTKQWVFCLLFLPTFVFTMGAIGRRGPCGGYGVPDPNPSYPPSCECSNVLDAWRSDWEGYDSHVTWETFVSRVQRCVGWCLEHGCAATREGAYNTCGPCVWHLSPYGYRLSEKNCNEGVDKNLYPNLYKNNKCPFTL